MWRDKMHVNQIIHGDYHDHMPSAGDVGLILTDPVYDDEIIDDLIEHTLCDDEYEDVPLIAFMFPINVVHLRFVPDELCHWLKPVSTKNTKRHYSNFVECIAMWNVEFHNTFGDKIHWANRTGIFTDVLISNEDHAWKKPESLIERLLRNHYPGHGIVFDPFAGSFTVDTVCRRLGIPSLSVECEERYINAYRRKLYNGGD